jgi:hypothetical protein
MNATQFVRQQVAEARSLKDAAMAGVTSDSPTMMVPSNRQ